ncbi:MAG: hypothetical protein ABI877_07915 [Gemmatimonadaceae bacterium]
MKDLDSAPILERLLAVTLASRAAFAQAAHTVRSPGFAALFVERTEDQARTATYLMEQLAPGVPVSLPTPTTPNHDSNGAAGVASASMGREPAGLLDECIRALDTSIREFSHAYGPATTLAQRIQLARHQNQMEWAREELFHLRRECSTPRFPKLKLDVTEPPGAQDAPRARASRYADRQNALLANAVPHDGVVAQHHKTGR